MNLNYTFENMFDGTYQARLCGEFVGYTLNKKQDEADKLIKEYGFDDRVDYLAHRLKQYTKR